MHYVLWRILHKSQPTKLVDSQIRCIMSIMHYNLMRYEPVNCIKFGNWSKIDDIDEDLLLDKLETGSDYQRGLACLNSKEKILVEQLKALGGDSEGAAPAVSNKRKSAMFLMAVCTG
jgi:hypothetical protein